MTATVSTEIGGPGGAVVEVGSYGLLAAFASADALASAAAAAHEAGYRDLDAYSPFPIEELNEALGASATPLPLLALIGACVGVVIGFGMQYLVHVVLLPQNVGGRPLDSWQMFIPITFEMGVLVSALTIVVGILVMNRLPELYHPVFNVPDFARATRDGFFLCIEARDAHFDANKTRDFLFAVGAQQVDDVAH
jgi:hypothetical protein